MTEILQAGFADPVHDSQRCFRAILDAMAHPGRIVRATGAEPPRPLGVAAAALMLTLVDHETPLWLDSEAKSAAAWIAFHCGAPIVPAPSASAFALTLSLTSLDGFAKGTDDAPETSTTLICQVDGLGTGKSLRLTGPGLEHSALLPVKGLPLDFISLWRANRALFPRGIDLILCADDQIVALPRTVSIEEG